MYILIIMLDLLVIARAQYRPTISPTSEGPPEDMRFFFDGVDYDLHNDDVKTERGNCFGQFLDCIRMTTPLHPVCAYDWDSKRYWDFYNICGVEIENCFFRANHYYRTNKYGLWWRGRTNNLFYHNGDAYTCAHYYRRARSPEEMDELYFNGDIERESFKEPERAMKTGYELPQKTTGLVPAPLPAVYN